LLAIVVVRGAVLQFVLVVRDDIRVYGKSGEPR